MVCGGTLGCRERRDKEAVTVTSRVSLCLRAMPTKAQTMAAT
jgi:hypothetical protein